VYRNPKKRVTATEASEFLQPGKQGAAGVSLRKGAGVGEEEVVNVERFWKKKEEEIPVDQVLFSCFLSLGFLSSFFCLPVNADCFFVFSVVCSASSTSSSPRKQLPQKPSRRPTTSENRVPQKLVALAPKTSRTRSRSGTIFPLKRTVGCQLLIAMTRAMRRKQRFGRL
jgi:hypothetical protein